MMRIVLIVVCAVSVGCGIGDRVSSAVGGMQVKQVETESLVCATAQFAGSVSIDCVEKKK
jgi:hypothetical protein